MKMPEFKGMCKCCEKEVVIRTSVSYIFEFMYNELSWFCPLCLCFNNGKKILDGSKMKIWGVNNSK